MHFDTQTFVALLVPLTASVFGLVGVAIKAFSAPSKDQHQAQVDLAQQALALVAQLAGAAAQAVKPEEEAPKP